MPNMNLSQGRRPQAVPNFAEAKYRLELLAAPAVPTLPRSKWPQPVAPVAVFSAVRLAMLLLLCLEPSFCPKLANAQPTPPGPYRISNASGLPGEDSFYSATASGEYVIMGTNTVPGQAVMFQLNGSKITRVGNASGISGED